MLDSDRTYLILYFGQSRSYMLDVTFQHTDPDSDRTCSIPIVHIRSYTLLNQVDSILHFLREIKIPIVYLNPIVRILKSRFRWYKFDVKL